jgi:hypothetical protein
MRVAIPREARDLPFATQESETQTEARHMAAANETLITMQSVKKIFYTDDLETHALSDVHPSDRQRRIRLHRRPFRLR